jgi:hypothetical protein
LPLNTTDSLSQYEFDIDDLTVSKIVGIPLTSSDVDSVDKGIEGNKE